MRGERVRAFDVVQRRTSGSRNISTETTNLRLLKRRIFRNKTKGPQAFEALPFDLLIQFFNSLRFPVSLPMFRLGV